MKRVIFLLLTVLWLFSSCEKDNLKSGNNTIFSKSTHLENNYLKSAKSDSEADFIWSQGSNPSNPYYEAAFYVKVTGIRGMLHGIRLMADSHPGSGPSGHWQLFSNENILFDLSGVQELLKTNNSELHVPGSLNSILFDVSYIDMDIEFKGVKSTIRCHYLDQPETGVMSGDIQILDEDDVFKWIAKTDRSLTSVRPANGEIIHLNTFMINNTDLGDYVLVFGADNFSSPYGISFPPPWSNRSKGIANYTFFDLNEESFVKDYEIVIDISMANAAKFAAHKEMKDGMYPDYYDTSIMPWFNYTIPFNGLDGITDQDGNPFSSPEFNILDILPGLAQPYCMCYITVNEIN